MKRHHHKRESPCRAKLGEFACVLEEDHEGAHRYAAKEAVRVELAPNGRQRAKLGQHVRLARCIWNWAIAEHLANGQPVGGKAGAPSRKAAAIAREKALAAGEKPPKPPKREGAYTLDKRWRQVRFEIAPWSTGLSAKVSSSVLSDVDQAYAHAFRRLREGVRGREIGWPRFHPRRPHGSYSVQVQGRVTNPSRRDIMIPSIGMVEIRRARGKGHPHPLDRLEGARVTRMTLEERAGRWWCSMGVERIVEEPAPAEGGVVGVDLGWSITLSDGRTYPPPRALEQVLRWISHWNKAASRRQPAPGQRGSGRYRKAMRMVARLHLRAAHVRKDWLAKVVHDLVTRYSHIVTEGFDVRRFVQHEVATQKNRRTILDVGWGALRSALRQKCLRTGVVYEEQPKHALTDQTCSRCGHTDPRTDGVFRCLNKACGHTAPRPRNTADLLERMGTGAAPISRPPSGGGAPGGQPGVNARGGANGDLGPRRRRSVSDHTRPQGGPGLQGSHYLEADGQDLTDARETPSTGAQGV